MEAHQSRTASTTKAIPRSLSLDQVTLPGSIVSVGVFGEVRKTVWMGTACAARKLPEGQRGEEQMKNCLLWNSLNHPNIVILLGVFAQPCGLHWVLTELLTVHLADLLKSSSHSLLPLPFKLSILQDVACAVRFLHSMTPRPLLHGDLQAEHVFLTPSVRAKLDLWDVFFASNQGMRKSASRGFMAHDVEVTYHLAPEVFVMGFSAVKQSGKVASDVFSFGTLCLHVLVQRLPIPGNFMSETREDTAFVYTEEQRRSEFINDLEDEEMHFLPIITKCLKSSPSDRPTMAELCDSLSQVQHKIGIDKLDGTVLGGGTVVDISNQLQHISATVDRTVSELEDFRIQLRSVLDVAKDARVPAPKSRSMPHKATKQMPHVAYSAALEGHRSLPAHYGHGSRMPTSGSPRLKTCKELDCPIEVCLWVGTFVSALITKCSL